MPWRLKDHVIRGEIDNRARNRVTGSIWLAGMDEPLVLDLKGDCHPDLAGCLLKFENPSPIPLPTRPPAPQQRGVAGALTAARKVRVIDLPLGEAYPKLKRGEKVPEHVANGLHLEWFSERSGLMVIETTDYRLDISEPAWRFTAEEQAEFEQRTAEDGESALANAIKEEGTDQNWDEFRCEQLLRESDLSGEKYRQLLEQYAEHPDSERIIAHEMGWDHLEDALAEEEDEEATKEEGRDAGKDEAEGDGKFGEDNDEEEGDDEAEEEDFATEDEFEEDPPDPAREGIDWVRDDEERLVHPLGKRSRELLYELIQELKLDEGSLAENDEAIATFEGEFMTLSVKLRSALGFIARADRYMDPGMIIAWLKRALEIHNQVLTAADALNDHPKFSNDRLAYYRRELFQIREEVLAIIARLRKEGGRRL